MAVNAPLLDTNTMYPRRSCRPWRLAWTGLALVVLSTVIVPYLLLAWTATLLLVYPVLSIVRRRCGSPRKMLRASIRLLSLGPWGVYVDGLWMPWWRLCCRRTVATYVPVSGEARPVVWLPPRPDGCVRFVLVSDTHAKMGLMDVPAGDVLIHSGDALARNGAQRCTARRALVRQFAAHLGRLPHPTKVYVGGNHDGAVESMGMAAATDVFKAQGVTYLQGSGCTLPGGLKVWGIPYYPPSRSSPNKAFVMNEAAMTAAFNAVPRDTDVLVTHGAPSRRFDAWSDMFGRAKIRLHTMGHLHDGHGVWRGSGDLITVNASSCDSVYRAVHGAVVVDLPISISSR